MLFLAVLCFCLLQTAHCQLTVGNSVILKSIDAYRVAAILSFGLFPSESSKSNTTSVRASIKSVKKLHGKQMAVLAKHPQLLREFQSQATGCVPGTSPIFNDARLLGSFIEGTGNVFVDKNANNVLDGPQDLDFLFDTDNYFFGVLNPAPELPDTTDLYEIVLSTNDLAYRRLLGVQFGVIGTDPTTGAVTQLLPVRFAAPELLAAIRFAPIITTPTENGPIPVALDPSARTGNLTCTSPPVSVDIGYLHLGATVPGEPNTVGGYNQNFTAAGSNQRLHLLTVFVDENADNLWNPWERYVSAAAIIALQNNPSTPASQRPFIIRPTPISAVNVTFSASPVAGDDTAVMLKILSPSPFGSAATEIILRPEFLGSLLPVCGPSSSTVIVGKNIQLASPASRSDTASYFVGTAQRSVQPVVVGDGTNTTTAGAARPYLPLVSPGLSIAVNPLLRSTNQFPLQCIEDSTINSPRQNSLATANANVGGTSAFRLSTAFACDGAPSGVMTLGTNVSCPMQICFLRQTENVTRFYEQARLLTFAAIITNATQSTISSTSTTSYVDVHRYSLSLNRGPLTAYVASTQILSSGIRKITFTHSLQRNTINPIPDTACMTLNYNIDYTSCSVGGKNLLIELAMLSATMPFPDFSIAARSVARELTQDPSCESFVGTTTPAPTTTTTTPAPTPPINRGSDNTLAFLLIVFFVVLLLSCCIWFYIY